MSSYSWHVRRGSWSIPWHNCTVCFQFLLPEIEASLTGVLIFHVCKTICLHTLLVRWPSFSQFEEVRIITRLNPVKMLSFRIVPNFLSFTGKTKISTSEIIVFWLADFNTIALSRRVSVFLVNLKCTYARVFRTYDVFFYHLLGSLPEVNKPSPLVLVCPNNLVRNLPSDFDPVFIASTNTRTVTRLRVKGSPVRLVRISSLACNTPNLLGLVNRQVLWTSSDGLRPLYQYCGPWYCYPIFFI